ncbi:hypothetical protein [Rhizobium sp. FKY42]|uniref:hypothetical protein n=1 Tax=Rhizobium sp. FKY42 TaxID=2562310 RepID=UPI0010BF8984|nr:hypothetical protein [Rhizobium sp. FKY42]
MFAFFSRSIAAKLLFVTGISIGLVLILANLALISQTGDRVQASTMEQSNAEAIAHEGKSLERSLSR